MLPNNMAQSVRLPCIISQKPSLTKTAAFVVAMATSIIMSNGIAASRVSNPARTNTAQMISKLPTNGPKNSGEGNPIFAKRPDP